jgi:polyphenol oxidase
MIFTASNKIPFFRFESIPENGRLQHAIFTRQGGVSPAPFHSLNLSVSVPDEKERVYANRQRAYGLYGHDTHSVVHAHLVHGRDVARVRHGDKGTWLPEVDAILTDEPGCPLTMNFADCAPILLYDPIHQAIGLGHAGWQGTVKNLPGAMVAAMQREFGSDPAQLLAGIGPCIGPCCYEVGEAVITAVTTTFANPETLLLVKPGALPAAPDHPMPAPGKPHFDLPEANRRNLQGAGVRQIELSGLCTACRTDLFFSHRAENGRTGRFGSIFLLS